MAASYCICSILPYSAVENLVEMHPEAFTTLVQTMVRMYHLKPDIGWYELTTKIVKKARVFNDEDAFQWFRLQDEKPDPEELHAKAFDLACRKLTVSHLDRRIFWSELDRDASGGISFEEFKGKLLFKEVCGDMPQQHSQLAGASNTASSKCLGSHLGVLRCAVAVATATSAVAETIHCASAIAETLRCAAETSLWSVHCRRSQMVSATVLAKCRRIQPSQQRHHRKMRCCRSKSEPCHQR